MTVGNQATVGQINSALSAAALSLRNDCRTILNLYEYVNAQGGGAGLTTGFGAIGFDSPDASSAAALLGYLNTVAGVYVGTTAQATDFDFDNALAVLWGGM